ncbi:DHS-like NAD/FAD-binding domain-containing protein [Halenospora varia]|nr:DHS-like NAD/FAD-binding domain-containing protein [Halenospora varia]
MSSSSSTPEPTFAPQSQIDSFVRHVSSSTRMLVLAGAGLSASAGIPTFRGNCGFWRGHKAADISNIACFEDLPALSWVYHAERRKIVIEASPGEGHRVLAEVARKGTLMLTQNIDGLSEKANHPRDRLYPLHGSLLDIKCSNRLCDYYDKDNFQDPICPALEVKDPKASFASKSKDTETEISSTDELPTPSIDQLPHCPKCTSLLRPAVVWFGESLSQPQFDEINAWIEEEPKLDLMLIVGTMAEVMPAARFVTIAKSRGARLCFVNMDGGHTGDVVVREKDWVFVGDASVILPVIFEGILVN